MVTYSPQTRVNKGADLDFLSILVQGILNGRPDPIFIHKLLVLWQFYGM
jgi:hypothetical protein